MASFPSTIPADSQEIADFIRWWLGNVSDTVISDADMITFIDKNTVEYGDDKLCKITYYSTVDILGWLIRAQAAYAGSSGATGEVTSRREKRGKTEIEVKYDVNSSDTTTTRGWDKILEDLLDNPSSIGCDPFADVVTTTGSVIIGGADINGYEEGFRIANVVHHTGRVDAQSGHGPF